MPADQRKPLKFADWFLTEWIRLLQTCGRSRTHIAAALNISPTMLSFWSHGQRPYANEYKSALITYGLETIGQVGQQAQNGDAKALQALQAARTFLEE